MKYVLVASLAAAGACKNEQAPRDPDPDPGSAAPPVVVDAVPAAAMPGCDLVGDYRLRFASNGADGWWWRFKVTTGAKGPMAELVAPVPVLGLEQVGPLVAKLDPSTCSVAVTARGNIGEMTAAVKLDPPTGNVTGELIRAKPRDAEEQKPAPMTGRRDPPGQPASPPGACVTPGVYRLAFDQEATYKPDVRRQPCDEILLDHITLRVEYLGATLHADVIGGKGVEAWAGQVKVKAAKGCNVALAYAGDEAKFDAKLTFAGANLTGTASAATYHVVQDGTAGEKKWSCIGKNVAITGAKAAPATPDAGSGSGAGSGAGSASGAGSGSGG